MGRRTTSTVVPLTTPPTTTIIVGDYFSSTSTSPRTSPRTLPRTSPRTSPPTSPPRTPSITPIIDYFTSPRTSPPTTTGAITVVDYFTSTSPRTSPPTSPPTTTGAITVVDYFSSTSPRTSPRTPPPTKPPTTELPPTSPPATTRVTHIDYTIPRSTTPEPPSSTMPTTSVPTTHVDYTPSMESTIPRTTPTPAPEETCTVDVSNDANYFYKKVQLPTGTVMADISRIQFAVRACSDAYMIISEGNKQSLSQGRNMYEIVIGGQGNSRSAIRDKKQDQGTRENELDREDHDDGPLDCNQFRTFYLSWTDGVIEVGTANPDMPFMSYSPGSAKFTVNHVYVAGKTEEEKTDGLPIAQWAIDFPCTESTEDLCEEPKELCSVLENYCDVDVADCVQQMCVEPQSPCEYLFNNTFTCSSHFFVNELNNITRTCGKSCGPEEMMVMWPEMGELPSCSDREAIPSTGDNSMQWKIDCVCNWGSGFFMENGACIRESECGCLMNNGDYRPLGDEWSAEDCSEDYLCSEVDSQAVVLIRERTCDTNSICVKLDDGTPSCACPNGKGVPTMPDGCNGVEEETQTCYLKGTPDEMCLCNKGYAPTCDGCQDINECAVEDNLCPDRSERCVNEPGSYRCDCDNGYKRNQNGVCVDVNECLTQDKPCQKAGEAAYCVNFIGAYGCECCAGYDMNDEGQCVRNTDRVPVLPEGSACCPCPKSWPECLQSSGGAGCYKNSGGYSAQYDSFRDMYEDQCLRKESVSRDSWTPGACPEDVPTLPPLGTPQPTEPAPSAPTTSPSEKAPCDPDNVCRKYDVPPALVGSEVCGPAGNEADYSSYCNMLVAMCEDLGGPDTMPPSPPSAKKGPCESTTTTEAPVPIEFNEWSEWSTCTPKNENKGCGPSNKVRTRTVAEDQPRQAKSAELVETKRCFVECPTTDAPGTPTTGQPVTEPEPEGCTETFECEASPNEGLKVCGKIGAEDPEIYPSECHLAEIACERGLPFHKMHNGQCDPEDTSAKRYCGDTVFKRMKLHVKPGRDDCKAYVAIADCSKRLCKGGDATSCCKAITSESIRFTYNCDNRDTFEGLIESATSCKCSSDTGISQK